MLLLGVQQVYQGIKVLTPEVYVPLAVTFFTAVGGLTATLWTTTYNKRKQVEADFREKKTEIYLSFLKIIEGLILNAGNSDEDDLLEPDDDLVASLADIKTKATLWSSPGVLVALDDFAKAGEGNQKRQFTAMDKIQREMRKDLGLSNNGLGELFFAKQLLKTDKDVEELMEIIRG